MPRQLSISRAQFGVAILTCLAVLAVGNLAVKRLTAHTVSRRVLDDARAASSASVIAIGNSLIRAGFIPEVFTPAQPAPVTSPAAVNLALGASSPVEQLLILREAFRANSSQRLLVYGFYDFQLTDPVQFSNADIIGNRDILYYQEPEFARRYFRMTLYDSAAFAVTRRLPMLYERGAVWAKVELLRRYLGQQGMPAESRNQFGRTADFTLLEAKSREEFEQHCLRASQAELNAPVAEIIREAQEHNRAAGVVFVLMPLPPKHVEMFYDTAGWASYQRHIAQLLRASGVRYVDASRWIPDSSKFGDALHLSDRGAQEFSRRLLAECSSADWSNFCSEIH
jgi:hypothetical protein